MMASAVGAECASGACAVGAVGGGGCGAYVGGA
jgi:hypothetical protein